MLTKISKGCEHFLSVSFPPGGGREGSTLGVSGWGCAAGTLEPLTYTRARDYKGDREGIPHIHPIP